MTLVRHTDDVIDALEHALRGVQTIECDRYERDDSDSDGPDDTSVEREVIVVLPRLPTRKQPR